MSAISVPEGASPAVIVDSVSQRFSLRHEKTIKGLLVNAVKRHAPSVETFLALDDVNLQIPQGSTTGLIGHNGSGKSTLLKIIGGVLTPTQGQVTRRGRLAALLELGAGFHRDLSGRENVYLNAEILGLSRSDIARKFDDIVEFSGVEQFIDTPMKFYSSGMFVRLGFSVAIHTDPDILLVDEVLAVGDEPFKAKCLDVIRSFQNEGRTIVLVTHNMDQVMQFCDQATLLHHGVVRSQGAPAGVIAKFRELTAKDAQVAKEAREAKLAGHVAATDTRPPTQASPSAQVVRVSATNSAGRPLGQTRTGDTLQIDATFAGTDGSPFVGRVELFSGGQLLHSASTDRLGLDPFEGTAEWTIRFTLPDLPLSSGRYRVGVSAAQDALSAPIHQKPAAVEFSVPASAGTSGPLAIISTATALPSA